MNPRVITGKYKKQTLSVPEGARPFTDRVKTSIFDSIQFMIENSSCLDLFAGSGSMGIEALSRGADFCTFVDISKKSIETVNNNLNKLAIPEDQFKVIQMDYDKFVKTYDRSFKIIFVDPPFEKAQKFNYNSIGKLLDENGIIILKLPKEVELDIDLEIIESRDIGINKVYFIKNK